MNSTIKFGLVAFYVVYALFFVSSAAQTGAASSFGNTASNNGEGTAHVVERHSKTDVASALEDTVAQCPNAKESPLPLPSTMSPDDFHSMLLAFLQNTEYVKLGWCIDRDCP